MEGRRVKSEDSNSSMANSTVITEEMPSGFALSSTVTSGAASSIFDMISIPCDVGADGNGSLGFMDLLDIGHDFGSSNLFDWYHQNLILPQQPLPSPASSNLPESSEVLNNNAVTRSSLSSSSNEAGNDTQGNSKDKDQDDEDQEKDQDKTKKQLKPKMKKLKRKSEPRFAFMTKSQVDHLDDGYRWRKYGQKSLKKSSYPRSYYRCASTGCGVKKRVERSWYDSTVVVTTYEGQHNHSHKGCIGIFCDCSFGDATPSFTAPQPQHQQHAYTYSSSPSLNITTTSATNFNPSFSPSFLRETPLGLDPPPASLIRDHGLLQDIVLSPVREASKEE